MVGLKRSVTGPNCFPNAEVLCFLLRVHMHGRRFWQLEIIEPVVFCILHTVSVSLWRFRWFHITEQINSTHQQIKTKSTVCSHHFFQYSLASRHNSARCELLRRIFVTCFVTSIWQAAVRAEHEVRSNM